jgi:hypothetical protein
MSYEEVGVVYISLYMGGLCLVGGFFMGLFEDWDSITVASSPSLPSIHPKKSFYAFHIFYTSFCKVINDTK